MPPTSSSTWKRAESAAGALFGARRRPLSGSSNRDDIDGDDAIHPRLWIESKYRASWAIFTLWDDVKAKASKCVRIFQGGCKAPVLVLRRKHHKGMLVVVHSDDLREVVMEYLAAQPAGELLKIEFGVRRRREGMFDAEAGQE
jgi:hypothetical protein